jgi:hypothetical protein
MSDEMVAIVLLVNAACTFAMVGLIWFVQVVHYPLFARVGTERFPEYQANHMRSTTWVVVVPMLLEGSTAALLVWQPPMRELAIYCWFGLALLLAIWASTALAQVPRHDALAKGFDASVHRQLVLSNWFRTVAWSMRGILVLFLLSRVTVVGDQGR